MLCFSNKLVLFVMMAIIIDSSEGIWCYRCTSATPGCSDNFNWRGIGYLGEQCPEDDDICVKVTERKGAIETITRECLSELKAIRSDIPPDHYEGCRPASKDVRLGHYVNNSITELDIHRDYYDETTFCFCFLDHRCNTANKSSTSMFLLVLFPLSVIFKKFFKLL